MFPISLRVILCDHRSTTDMPKLEPTQNGIHLVSISVLMNRKLAFICTKFFLKSANYDRLQAKKVEREGDQVQVIPWWRRRGQTGSTMHELCDSRPNRRIAELAMI